MQLKPPLNAQTRHLIANKVNNYTVYCLIKLEIDLKMNFYVYLCNTT